MLKSLSLIALIALTSCTYRETVVTPRPQVIHNQETVRIMETPAVKVVNPVRVIENETVKIKERGPHHKQVEVITY